MSPIGRIFSVLNLVLAAVFLAWAAMSLAAKDNVQGQLDTEKASHETTRTDLNEQISQLRADLEGARNDADRLLNERDAARAEANRNRTELESAQAANADIRADLDKISGTIGDLEENNRNLQASKDQAVQARVDAEKERDAALAAQTAAEQSQTRTETENRSLAKTIEDQQMRIHELEGDVSGLNTQLATLIDVTGASLKDITAQPLINATVVKAVYDIDPGLVALNVGETGGVKRGHTFSIYNGKEYKGEVRVENVRENMCTALITDLVAGKTIRQGDSAATRL